MRYGRSYWMAGARVKVIDDVSKLKEQPWVSLNMLDYAGKEAIIESFDPSDGSYTIDLDEGAYEWSYGCFEDVTRFKVGDKVMIRPDVHVEHQYGKYTYTDTIFSSLYGKQLTIRNIVIDTDDDDNMVYEFEGETTWAHGAILHSCRLPRLEVGKVVTIRDDIAVLRNRSPRYGINESMIDKAGRDYVVKEIMDNGLGCRCENSDWSWSIEMLGFYANFIKGVKNMENNNDVCVMNTESEFELSDELRARLVEQGINLLHKFGYPVTEKGVNAILDKWSKEKGWLIDLLSKSPYYNGYFQVEMPIQLYRKVDKTKISEFLDWYETAYQTDILSDKIIRVGQFFTYGDYLRMARATENIADMLNDYMTYKGFPRSYYVAEYERLRKRIAEIREKYHPSNDIYVNGMAEYISREDNDTWVYSTKALKKALLGYKDRPEDAANILQKGELSEISEYCEYAHLKVRPRSGQRVMKFVEALCKEVGINKVKQMREVSWEVEVHDEDGTSHMETRSKEKDFGWNYQKTELGNGVNPLEYERSIVISVNPIDFWTQSFGFKWASCMTIDKENIRNITSNHYSGCYSGGTESYMLDSATIITYIRPTESQLKDIKEEGLPMEEQSKFKRCLFYLGKDKLVQSRLYPDGRDGGDESLAAQIRKFMQGFISELYNVTNLWVIKKGTTACCNVIDTASGASHYKDYSNYSDCNVSYLKRDDGTTNSKRITVGSKIICPSCGNEHTSEESITCNRCPREGSLCENCGCETSSDDRVEIGGHMYCCLSCAEEDGWVWAVDAEDWRREDECRQDDNNDSWYYYIDDGIESENEYGRTVWFYNSESAEEAGYVYCEYDDEWTYEDNALLIGDTCEYFMISENSDYVEINGEYFPNDEYAERNGYIWSDLDDEWANKDDVLEIGETGEYFIVRYHDDCIETEDGLYFPDEETAVENGYIHDEETDTWVEEVA